MPSRTRACVLNIHKRHKYLKNQTDASKGLRQEVQDVQTLAKALRSPSPIGRVLRTLVRRLEDPQAPYQGEDMENLLVLSLAQMRNQEWK
jgi:hypothetical protein